MEEAITHRAEKKGLTVTPKKMRYTVRHWMSFVQNRHRVLDIGCGHGHFLVLLCTEFGFKEGVGVDPLVEGDGTSRDDWAQLKNLIRSEQLESTIRLHEETVGAFLRHANDEKFSLITACDVLHHIYCTSDPLHVNAEMFHRCTELFVRLKEHLTNDGILLIDDLTRSGLRPWIERTLGRESVDWSTKQKAKEWALALNEAGFTAVRKIPYVPYSLRFLHPLFLHSAGKWLACPRYFLIASKTT